MAGRTPLLSIKNLSICVEGKNIVRGVSLEIREGEVHAIMGPNGAGKSTLALAIMGHPGYEIAEGTVRFRGKDLLSVAPHERARAGLFLSFQYPRAIPGVSLRSFLFAAFKAQMSKRDPRRKILSPVKFKDLLSERMETLKIDPSFAERSVNQGFSGGEKKKAEILQLAVLQPLLALLDETDSGLDLDALRTVAEGLQSIRSERKRAGEPFSALLVTHYARILQHFVPDRVHVMVGGSIVESGSADLARELEKTGYRRFKGGQ